MVLGVEVMPPCLCLCELSLRKRIVLMLDWSNKETVGKGGGGGGGGGGSVGVRGVVPSRGNSSWRGEGALPIYGYVPKIKLQTPFSHCPRCCFFVAFFLLFIHDL